MNRTFQFLVGGLVAAALFSACSSSDAVAPLRDLSPRFSGSATGGGGGGGGGGTGGGGGGTTKPASCTNTLSVTGTASEALTGNTFSAVYTLNACQSKTHVSMTVTDVSTGQVVWQSVPDLAGTTAVWTLPYNLTSYRIDATAVTGSANTVIATASTIVSTLDALPCTTFVHQTVTVGYYLTWPAVWAASDAQDCGQGGTVHLKVTNLNTNQVELDSPGLSTSTMIDFEGAQVSYDTPYRVYVELLDRNGSVLSTSSTDVRSSPLK